MTEESLSGDKQRSLGLNRGEPFSRTGSESRDDFMEIPFKELSLSCQGFDKLCVTFPDLII